MNLCYTHFMTNIVIRSYQKQDEAAIEEIVYRTGYNGEDLTGLHYIDDKRLFFLIFGAYYVWYEPEHCFVAVDIETNKVVGYIFGTPDTVARWVSRSNQLMLWHIYSRAFLVTSWRYPQTFRTLLQMRKMEPEATTAEDDLAAKYPAHLHINVLPEYHGRGIGSQLIKRFEAHLVELNVTGLHLGTSNHNVKALPFYKKMGYEIVKEVRMKSHPRLSDYTIIYFAKRLKPGDE